MTGGQEAAEVAWLGYTLRELHHIATVYCRWGDRFGFPDKFEIAWAGVVDHLAGCDQPPESFDLYKAGQRAISRASERELREHGLTRGSDGLQAMPHFDAYWAHKTSPAADAAVVDRLAVWQIWPRLRPLHQMAFLALAAHGDYRHRAGNRLPLQHVLLAGDPGPRRVPPAVARRRDPLPHLGCRQARQHRPRPPCPARPGLPAAETAPAPARHRACPAAGHRITESSRPGTHQPGRDGGPARCQPRGPGTRTQRRRSMATITATREDTVQPRPDPRQPAVPAGWPLRVVLDLGALPTAPGCARAWTREILWEWQMTGLAGTAELIVSELTTNSVLASRHLDRPAIRLILVSGYQQIVIFVRHFDPGIPVPRHASEDEESGRGLLLVESISDRFGWYRPDDGTPGKVIWAVVSPE
jgi:anti-sigma regulatory factor (Ser/Thr protein kinase)